MASRKIEKEEDTGGKKKMNERVEALARIPIGIVASIILGLWQYLIIFLVVVHFFYVLVFGRRHRGIAEFANLWVTYQYRIERYLNFTTNRRVFPFEKMGEVIEKVEIE